MMAENIASVSVSVIEADSPSPMLPATTQAVQQQPTVLQSPTAEDAAVALMKNVPTSTTSVPIQIRPLRRLSHDDHDLFHSADESTNVSARNSQRSTPVPLDRPTMVLRVTKLVDFYFGDENYAKDRFLRTKARENSEGWVPLDLITSFKRMKKLTTDEDVLLEGIRESQMVVLNEDESKIKRKDKLPVSQRDRLFNTAVLENIPQQTTRALVSEQLKAIELHPTSVVIHHDCASLDEVRLLLSTECSSGKAKAHSGLARESVDVALPLALVEFESAEECQAACTLIGNSGEDWRGTMQALPLCRKEKKQRRQRRRPPGGGSVSPSMLYSTDDSAAETQVHTCTHSTLRATPLACLGLCSGACVTALWVCRASGEVLPHTRMLFHRATEASFHRCCTTS
eukprot:m.514479 g.514479  ORF g.514479 m.514479 type:complete len:399 (-) comp21912_c0_seq9:2938-4134(-)